MGCGKSKTATASQDLVSELDPTKSPHEQLATSNDIQPLENAPAFGQQNVPGLNLPEQDKQTVEAEERQTQENTARHNPVEEPTQQTMQVEQMMLPSSLMIEQQQPMISPPNQLRLHAAGMGDLDLQDLEKPAEATNTFSKEETIRLSDDEAAIDEILNS